MLGILFIEFSMTTSNVKIFKEVNSEVEVFIHEIIKEDARILVGFRKLKEREIFCNLLSFKVLEVKCIKYNVKFRM